MRTLAIDHGLARCGCAITDGTGTIVRPLEPIEPPDATAVARLAEAESADRIVVGLPLSLDGTEGEQVSIVRAFCAQLEGETDIPVRTWDERLTTSLATASRRAGAGAAEDSLAAAHLLESYIAAEGDRE